MSKFFFTFWHQLFDLSRLIGLRDRLRCPRCEKIGYWKPHGGWLDFEDQRKVRRWLCKWCGHYVDTNGFDEAALDLTHRVWTLKQDGSGKYITPRQIHLRWAKRYNLRTR